MMIRCNLTKGYEVLLDEADADLAELRWYAVETRWGVYAHRTVGSGEGRQRLILHRVIGGRMGLDLADMSVDHINGDTLDNRRANLRAVTTKENARNIRGPRSHNTSGALGVSYDKSRGKWMAFICQDKKLRNLGRFDNKDDAIAARLAAESVEWGIQPRRAGAHGGTNIEVRTTQRHSGAIQEGRRDNKSGHAGVHWAVRDQRWIAFITRAGKRKGLGYYKTKDEAVAARLAAEQAIAA
jgi:hypothetical protein